MMMREMEYWNEIEGIGILNIEMELLVGLEPVLFVCVLEDNPNEKYLVMTYNSTKSTYVMRKINDVELLCMLDKRVSMEETFRNGKEILMTYEQDDCIYVERFNPREFSEDMLPKKGATYNIHSQYILDYKEELRIPKYEIKLKYNAYEIGQTDFFIGSIVQKGDAILLNPLYQPVIVEESSYYDCKLRKIA